MKETIKYNARVLKPNNIHEPGRLALSIEAIPHLQEAGIPYKPGAGGVVAALNPLPEELIPVCEQAVAGYHQKEYQWIVKGRQTVPLQDQPLLMGVVNATPDSFSDGGRFFDLEDGVRQAAALIEAGADIIDVGGESTRPGSEPVSTEEEIRRTAPLIKRIAGMGKVLISIDTTKAKVAETALDQGAQIINDISGLTFDPQMAPLAARTGAGLVLMHIRKTPKDMQEAPYYEDTLAEICLELRQRVKIALDAGADPKSIVLDPGIGFGKRFEDNLRILSNLQEMKSMGFPLLIGASRKSMLGTITGRKAEDRDLETCALSVAAAMQGVQILRVHNVKDNGISLKVAFALIKERRKV